MIRVTVLYPNGDGARFDNKYYLDQHMPMVKKKLGAACKRVAVEQGMSGAEPGSKPPNFAICQLDFESVDAFQSAFAPHAGEILGDIPNYTSVQPTIQVSEVKM